MAYLEATLSGWSTGSTTGGIWWQIRDLSNPANQYSQFRVQTSDGKSNTWTSTSTGNVTTWTSSGHSCGSTITGQAWATFNGVEYYIGSTSIATPACPSPPGQLTGLSTLGKTVNSITIGWNATPNATGYHIYRDLSYITSTSSTSYTYTGLTAGVVYRLGVIPYNSVGNGIGADIYDSPLSPRPSNFNWTYAGRNVTTGTPVTGTSKSSELGFYLTANEFAGLQSKINEFRNYKGLSNYSFTTVSSGGLFYNYLFNQCVTAISAMSPPLSPPSTVSSGQSIAASMLNGLKNSLNSIP